METILIVGIIVLAIAIVFSAYLIYKSRVLKSKPGTEVQNIETLVKYVEAQKNVEEQKQKLKELKTAEQREKLEKFKQTKEELKGQLKNQLDSKEWFPLESILKKLDKGNVGIYVLYNETKGKYYVGQSKELFTRIKKHFEIEPIALDYINGDVIKVKILSASELGSDYRMDHIEKTGIELFEASSSGYNKTTGNI